MKFTLQQFKDWGAQGGRMRANRLSKARRKQIAKQAADGKKNKYYLPTNGKRGPKPKDYSDAVEMYSSGKTLEEIGATFGVSRQRIQQIFKKKGITQIDGGRAIKMLLKTDDKIKALAEAKNKSNVIKFRSWGMSKDRYDEFVASYGSVQKKGSPFYAYANQRRAAKRRGVDWEISFLEWWQVWCDSGKWSERGKGQGKYVMSRWGDHGGYRADNVNIILATENNSDRPQKNSGLPIGVTKIKNKFKATKMIDGKSLHVGTFDTAEKASAAYKEFTGKNK